MSLRYGFFSCALAALLLAGCSSQPERPTEQLTRAKTLIDQAEKSGAQRYAAADLETARNKLQAANKAADDGEQGQATHLATEAALDAEYAMARAGAGEAQKAAEEVGRSTEQLRQETTRPQATGGAPATTATPGTMTTPSTTPGTTTTPVPPSTTPPPQPAPDPSRP